MPMFRKKVDVEARQWFDTDEKREEFCAWFDARDYMFETLGPQICVGRFTTTYGDPGCWVVWDDEFDDFFVIPPESFARLYAPLDAEVK